ncbi:MAG: hypothetical protein RMJ56_07395 [Gemmataceae bacterium]|nr:hypothetical protein [Gemmata sp.]MDW8197416.1 hypothetical protein [Gemmataceae bacterium]
MLRISAHLGLAAVIIFAPLACCCTVRQAWHAVWVAIQSGDDARSTPATSCCAKTSSDGHHEPCRENPPACPTPPPCACWSDRPDATQPESPVAVDNPERTSERLPPVTGTFARGGPEHLALGRGLDPPQRFEVDTRSEALHRRHVLRC